MRQITLTISNDKLAENIIGIIEKIKGIDILEKKNKPKINSKIIEILNNPFDIDDFKILKRDEIYERESLS